MYEQYSKRPRLALVLGETANMAYSNRETKGLQLMAATSVLNAGAADALIMRVEGTLLVPDGTQRPVAWRQFQDRPVEPGAAAPGIWSFTGDTSPLIAPSRKALTIWILYDIGPPFEQLVAVGEYELRLNCVVAGHSKIASWLSPTARKKNLSACREQFRLTADNLETLRESCVLRGDGNLGDYLPVKIKQIDRRSLVAP
jgi:hypothetical protein